MVGTIMEEEARRLKRHYRVVHNEGKLSKCRCGWIRFRMRLPEGRVVEFYRNRECPCFDDSFREQGDATTLAKETMCGSGR